MKPTTKKLLSTFRTRREIYPKSPNNQAGRKFLAHLDKRARREYGNAAARKGTYLKNFKAK